MAAEIQQRNQAEAALIRQSFADEGFKSRLLSDPTAVYNEALQDAGGALEAGTEVKVIEESPEHITLVIPDFALSFDPPTLDERATRGDFEAAILIEAANDSSAKSALLKDPRAVYSAKLAEVRPGASLPESMKIDAVEETDNLRYFRLPHAAIQTGGELSEEELEKVAGGAIAVGIAIASTVVVGAAVVAAILAK